ncbi:hypothetical protein Efla_007441 [Eimeria flavescens]
MGGGGRFGVSKTIASLWTVLLQQQQLQQHLFSAAWEGAAAAAAAAAAAEEKKLGEPLLHAALPATGLISEGQVMLLLPLHRSCCCVVAAAAVLLLFLLLLSLLLLLVWVHCWRAGGRRDVRAFLKHCAFCIAAVDTPHTWKWLNLPIGTAFEIGATDFFGPLKTTRAGNTHIFVFIDYDEQWVNLIPMGLVECMELVARGRLHPTMSDPLGKLPEGEENEECGVSEEDEQRPSIQGSSSSSSGREETTEVLMTTAAIPAEAKSIKTKTLEGPPGGDVVLLALGRFSFLGHGSWATEKDPMRNQAISRWVLELCRLKLVSGFSVSEAAV